MQARETRAATCDGPNSAPIVTTVPASMPPRPKIASRWADNPEGTNRIGGEGRHQTRMNGHPPGACDRAGGIGRSRSLADARARQCEGMQRGSDAGEQRGIHEIGAVPAAKLDQK